MKSESRESVRRSLSSVMSGMSDLLHFRFTRLVFRGGRAAACGSGMETGGRIAFVLMVGFLQFVAASSRTPARIPAPRYPGGRRLSVRLFERHDLPAVDGRSMVARARGTSHATSPSSGSRDGLEAGNASVGMAATALGHDWKDSMLFVRHRPRTSSSTGCSTGFVRYREPLAGRACRLGSSRLGRHGRRRGLAGRACRPNPRLERTPAWSPDPSPGRRCLACHAPPVLPA